MIINNVMDYFGARYYSSDLSIWLSVDPLSDMYPSTSPYMYVRGNPIMRIDPNGMNDDEWDVNMKTGETTWVGPKGGTETQHYNVKDGNGNLLSTVSTPGNYSSIYSNSITSSGSSTSYLSIYGSNGTDNAYHTFSDTQLGDGDQNGGGGNDGITMQEAGVGLTSFGISFTAKSNIYTALEGGKNAPKYFKTASKFGTRLSYLGLGMTAYDGLSNGWGNSHSADMLIQSSLITVSAINPVVGGVAAGIYFIGDLGFQYFHDGQSITQYYLDNN